MYTQRTLNPQRKDEEIAFLREVISAMENETYGVAWARINDRLTMLEAQPALVRDIPQGYPE